MRKCRKYFDIVNYLELQLHSPGGFVTLDFWRKETNISNKSIILDLCCPTGLFSRYMAIITHCSGYGRKDCDISSTFIKYGIYIMNDPRLHLIIKKLHAMPIFPYIKSLLLKWFV